MKQHKKQIFALMLALVMAFAVTGCGKTDAGTTTAPAGGAQTQAPAGEKRTDLRMTLAEVPATMDPHYYGLIVEQTMFYNVYEMLFFIEDDSSEVPMLATDYTISPDGLQYVFHIRPNVKFQNGEILTAKDVVFSIERAAKSPHHLGNTEMIEKVEATGDLEVTFTLKYQFAPFLSKVSSICIMNEKWTNEVGEDGVKTQMCGTGAYQLDEHKENISLSLKAFDDYWGGAPQIKNVSWKFITDVSTALIAFESGELDYIGVPTANWNDISANPKYQSALADSIHVTYIMMNHEVEPFNNPVVRRALNMAINKEDCCLMAADGLAAPAYTLAKPGYVFGATEDVTKFEYNPEQAKALLAEAGYPEGFDAGPIRTLAGYFQKVAQIAQSNLAEIGVTSTVEVVESNVYVSDCVAGNFGLAMMGVIVGTDYSNYDMLYHSKYINNLNMARYSNPEVDKMFEDALQMTDSTERAAAYKDLIEIVQNDAVYIPVFFKQVPWAADPGLNVVRHLNTMLVRELSWK